MNRARTNNTNEIRCEKSCQNVLTCQFHVLITQHKPIKHAHQQITRFWRKWIGLNNSPDTSHRLSPAEEDKAQKQRQLNHQQNLTEGGIHEDLMIIAPQSYLIGQELVIHSPLVREHTALRLQTNSELTNS